MDAPAFRLETPVRTASCTCRSDLPAGSIDNRESADANIQVGIYTRISEGLFFLTDWVCNVAIWAGRGRGMERSIPT